MVFATTGELDLHSQHIAYLKGQGAEVLTCCASDSFLLTCFLSFPPTDLFIKSQTIYLTSSKSNFSEGWLGLLQDVGGSMPASELSPKIIPPCLGNSHFLGFPKLSPSLIVTAGCRLTYHAHLESELPGDLDLRITISVQ